VETSRKLGTATSFSLKDAAATDGSNIAAIVGAGYDLLIRNV
jgi:hypothetical protein